MKRITLTAPENATREEKAAWVLYPDHAIGTKSCQYVHSQPQNRKRIIRLASGGYGEPSMLSRRQKNEVAEFNRILATIA